VVVDIASYLASALGIGALCYLVYLAAHTDEDRSYEDRQRDFFDEHGRWPDEPESAAVPSPIYADVDRLPEA
jgi:alkanesulfonate monooxygenase SsuD/methylene tetrahydromethanopterin reductase-like flavin-dependent oxidoreductase (luciferase family)